MLAHKHTQWGHQTARLQQATHCCSGVQETANDTLTCTESGQSEQGAAFRSCTTLFHTNMVKHPHWCCISLSIATESNISRAQKGAGVEQQLLLSTWWRLWSAPFKNDLRQTAANLQTKSGQDASKGMIYKGWFVNIWQWVNGWNGLNVTGINNGFGIFPLAHRPLLLVGGAPDLPCTDAHWISTDWTVLMLPD